MQNAVEAYEKLREARPEDREAVEKLKELYGKRRAYRQLYDLYDAEAKRAASSKSKRRAAGSCSFSNCAKRSSTSQRSADRDSSAKSFSRVRAGAITNSGCSSCKARIERPISIARPRSPRRSTKIDDACVSSSIFSGPGTTAAT